MSEGSDDYWLDLDAERLAPDGSRPNAPFLDLSVLPGVAALDKQAGIWPMRTVPVGLEAALFGPEAGGPDIPRTYAVIDAAALQGGANEIATADLPFDCLFRGTAARDIADGAPYVVELDESSSFTRRLFTHIDGIDAHVTSVHMWRRAPAMFLRTDASLPEVCQHFRRFTMYRDQRGRWRHLRFWEGAVFPSYWERFATSYDRVAQFFCGPGLDMSFTCFYLHDGTVVAAKPNMEALRAVGRTPTAFEMTRDDDQILGEIADARLIAGVRSRLDRDLASAPPELRGETDRTARETFAYLAARGTAGKVALEDCVTLALLTILWGPAAPSILDGPVLNEPLTPIGQRVALARRSYFDALSRLRAQED